MLIVTLLLYIVVSIYLLRFFNSILSILFEKIYIKKLNKVKKTRTNNIYVLLPALREQKIVNSTLEHFSKMKYTGKIKFIVITTEKENYENKNNDITTDKLVDKYIKEKNLKNFYHLHYPYTKGNKSSQLNYAIDKILETEHDLKNTYISVFDFDSKPDKNTFENLNKVSIMKNNPDVISQVPINYKNYVELSKNKKNFLLLLSSLQQNLRSCGIEKPKLLLSSLTNIKPAQYCMGACMHINLQTLVDNENFPIFVDDLTLGYRLSIKEAKFAYLPDRNFVLIPNKLSDCFNQSVLIFKGVLTFFSEIKKAKGNIWGKFKVFLEGGFNILEITILPYIILFYLVYSVITNDITTLFWLLLLIHYLWSISSYINLKVFGIKDDDKLTSLLAIIFSPIWFICKTFGSFIYYKRYIYSKLLKKEITYRKTER